MNRRNARVKLRNRISDKDFVRFYDTQQSIGLNLPAVVADAMCSFGCDTLSMDLCILRPASFTIHFPSSNLIILVLLLIAFLLLHPNYNSFVSQLIRSHCALCTTHSTAAFCSFHFEINSNSNFIDDMNL